MDQSISTVLVFLTGLLSFGLTASTDRHQAAFDARARLSSMRDQRANQLGILIDNFDLDNCEIQMNLLIQQETELEEEIKLLDPKVKFEKYLQPASWFEIIYIELY